MERALRAAQTTARKKDTREKIQLGGLIVKAGLRQVDRAILMGALADINGRLNDQTERDRLGAIGKEIFDNDAKQDNSLGDAVASDADRRHRPAGD